MAAPGRVPVAILAGIAALSALGPVGTRVTAAAPAPSRTCEDAFRVAEAVRVMLHAVWVAIDGPDRPPGVEPTATDLGLLDITIAGCAGRREWLAIAEGHRSLLGEQEPADMLAARCIDPASDLSATPTCRPPVLVARPDIVPRVAGADRTRTYPIRGASPDELFTQMQLNGSAGCPTHALACALIQPVLRPLVTTGSDCRVIGIDASLSTQAVVPRWVGPRRVPRELAGWWRTVARRIGRHEAEHIRIAERRLAQLRRGIIGRSCASLQTFVDRWSRDLTQAQDAFDRREARRPWPPYEGPLP